MGLPLLTSARMGRPVSWSADLMRDACAPGPMHSVAIRLVMLLVLGGASFAIRSALLSASLKRLRSDGVSASRVTTHPRILACPPVRDPHHANDDDGGCGRPFQIAARWPSQATVSSRAPSRGRHSGST